MHYVLDQLHYSRTVDSHDYMMWTCMLHLQMPQWLLFTHATFHTQPCCLRTTTNRVVEKPVHQAAQPDVLVWPVFCIHICLVDFVKDIKAFCHLTKHGMDIVQVVYVFTQGDEKLQINQVHLRSKGEDPGESANREAM